MDSLFSIKDKHYLLSGARGALGGSIANYLVGHGAKVILLGRSEEKLASKQKELDKIQIGHAHTFVVDLLDEAALGSLKQKISKEFEKLDGIVNLAGGNIPGATLQEGQTIYDVKIEDTKEVVDLNLFGTVTPTIVLSELMAKQGFGSIINISSMAARQSIS
ncbi:MAG: SDR family NAD(P)-dependent oxidoreductase, partial [Allomuricauda sp.]